MAKSMKLRAGEFKKTALCFLWGGGERVGPDELNVGFAGRGGGNWGGSHTIVNGGRKGQSGG